MPPSQSPLAVVSLLKPWRGRRIVYSNRCMNTREEEESTSRRMNMLNIIVESTGRRFSPVRQYMDSEQEKLERLAARARRHSTLNAMTVVCVFEMPENSAVLI